MINYWDYDRYQTHQGFNFFGVFIVLMLVDLVLRGMALWKSARNGHNVWFIFLLIINSVGILPLIYILTHREETVKTTKKKK